MELILASQSPRRKELLGLFHIPFSVRVAQIDETMDREKSPYDEVARLSREKALAVEPKATEAVVAADTVVVCDAKVLGKPHSPEEAREMLTLLSGRAHQVMTGLSVVCNGQMQTVTEVTDVHFRPLSPGEIEKYVATGEPMDKAGAYAIQGGGAVFVQSISGDYYNVVGLPVCRLWRLLASMAPQLLEGKE